ncbi:hypothetical protein EJ04DRAFT_513687 [Polyplosphaeria fusca]|uniref:Uncharacterized protein n=1 Tax=Polyplosphaeria fusca TaxID=682080 RepID=A0A9P4QWT3_9PLEO|nr:hypothetical protein EJ04DRAFT_513687 [Polyplosphaeria fusca]
MCQGVPDMHMDAVEPKSVDTVTDTVLKRDNDVDDSDTCPSACWWTLADCIHISRLGTVTGNPDCHAQTCGSKHNIKSASAGYCASCIFCQPGVFKDPQAPEPFVIDGKKREGVEREVEYPETDMPALKDVQGKKGCESWCKTIYDDCMKVSILCSGDVVGKMLMSV